MQYTAQLTGLPRSSGARKSPAPLPGGRVTRISVGVITRQRPRLVGRLLDSLAACVVEPGYEIVFVVVENDKEKTLQDQVATFEQAVPWATVVYALEPQVGIPFARNRAMEIALDMDCDVHAFVDDDECVDPVWLMNLLRAVQQRELDLAGGPMRPGACQDPVGWWQRIVWAGLAHRQGRVEQSAWKAWKEGRDSQVMVATNNWMIDLAWLRETGLRFDERLRHSGGSDTLFFRQAKSLGARSGWVPDAITYEHVPQTRLGLVYQFCRGRDQAMCSYHAKYPRVTGWLVLRSAGFVAGKVLVSLALLGLAVVDGGRSLVRSSRMLGIAVGRIAGMLGWHSRHYQSVHGD